MTVMEPEQKLQNARSLQGDMPLIDRFTNEIKATTKNVSLRLNVIFLSLYNII